MSRLIDADAVLERIERDCDARCLYKDYKEPLRSKMCNCCDLGDARMYVEDAPTVDAEPIRHGHWNILTPQDDDGGWVAISCSNCNFVTPYASSRKEIEENGFVYHYCMYCGAKMEEIVDAGDENT